jgi:hypothetical protein
VATTTLLEPQTDCPTHELEFARSVIAACKFKGATQGNLGDRPVTESPHEYCRRDRVPADRQADLDRLLDLIDVHGYRGRFLSTVYRYLNIDGWRYWASRTAFPPPGVIINRANNERAPMSEQPQLSR